MTTLAVWSARVRAAQGWRGDGYALLFGAVSAAALPPLHIIPALLVAAPGLFLLIGAAPGPLVAARRAFFFGLAHHVLGLYWITEAILLESARYWWLVPLAVPALSALLALFIALPCGLARMAPDGWRRVVFMAGAWTLGDLARQYVGTGFPWNPWGSVWAVPGPFGDVMLQPLAWVGTPGLTLATVLLALLPTLGRPGWFAGGTALAAWAGAGAVRLAAPEPPAPGLQVVLVQGNVTQGQKWDRAAAIAAFDKHLALTRSAVAAAGPDVVVIWPETSSVFLLQSDKVAREVISEAAQPARAALVGSLTFTRGAPSNDPDNLPRNSMVAIDAQAGVSGIYDKWHLVPFGEFAPSWVPFSIQIVPGRFGFGAGPATLRVPGVPPFGPLICYEAVYPGQLVQRDDRPDWLVNITNDAWFGNSTGPRQHLAAARMRAVEEGLPLMRAANTGITAGYDSRGREGGRTSMRVATTLTLPLPGKRPPTSFSRLGLAIPGLLAVLCVAVSTRRRGSSTARL